VRPKGLGKFKNSSFTYIYVYKVVEIPTLRMYCRYFPLHFLFYLSFTGFKRVMYRIRKTDAVRMDTLDLIYLQIDWNIVKNKQNKRQNCTCNRSLGRYSSLANSDHGVCLFFFCTCNRPWRPIESWDVEAPTFSKQSAHRWRWDCQPYAPAGRSLTTGKFLVLISDSGWMGPKRP
jgi:hypothetical protein